MKPLNRPLFIKDHIERLLCPLPLAIDSYRGCGGGCAYCSLHGLRTGIIDGEVVANSLRYVEKFFYHHKPGMVQQLIEQRCPVQFGISSDPLQPSERRHRISLRILRILQDRQYPTIICTKFPNQLVQPEYLRALDSLPLVVQCSTSGNEQLEPGCPSIKERMDALQIICDAGVKVQLRLWPYASDISGDIEQLLGRARDVGCSNVLCNPLKIYHAGISRGLINAALGRDYLATTQLQYENHGLFDVPSHEDLSRELSRLKTYCRSLGMRLLNSDDSEGRGWQSCCGIDDLPGFEGIAKWAYFVNGHRIKEHTGFDDYMRGHDCPWHTEFEQEWNKGKLAESILELIFHDEDKTYTRLKSCAETLERRNLSSKT